VGTIEVHGNLSVQPYCFSYERENPEF